MPLAIPSLEDLRSQTRAQFVARISGANPSLRRMIIKVLADVVAGGLWLVYRFLVRLSEQLFLDSADGVYLRRQAAIDGLSPTGASVAAGNVIFVGTPDGLTVPSGLLLQNADGTAEYTTQASGVLASGSVTLPIEATTGGAAGNVDPGASLTLMVAVPGVQPTATVDGAGLSGGLDAESEDAFRARALDRRRLPPQGGDSNDYVQWAEAVAGVTRAWCYPLNRGPGTVDVSFVMDARANIIPLAGDLATVQAAIDLAKPVCADCVVFAPVADSINVTITGLVPNSPAMQTAVRASLAALFATTTPGGASIGSGISGGVAGGLLYLERISDAVAQTPGVVGFDLTAPAADVTSAAGHIARLGTVTFA